nr:immunoglobulin heavy chain junction region [Macaca mulatta]MOY23967.1 immunoglobulin heavy chain junction region [Macaca mulatta]MOY27380.1 immunoglobulin heavy chain junction region [Macaca mulatta]MOY27615.1 immunoglobulin heavy chain junction region [Macaca mulatta]MOY29636.1 immunoglobulin heavy chain junction region [Macaca mulatta]
CTRGGTGFFDYW